jgi:3-oxoacyl-[acyl-carrier-protein] synthase III
MLSLAGSLQAGDISVIVGAENIHRAKAFKPMDTANIIFGDDAVATALKTTSSRAPTGRYKASGRRTVQVGGSVVDHLAEGVLELIGNQHIDGIIIDNQMGDLTYRVPASAVRVQHALVQKRHPETATGSTLGRFTDALHFYDDRVQSFAFDIKSLSNDPQVVETIARAYVEAGKYRSIVSIHITEDLEATLVLHSGEGFEFQRPLRGIIDTRTTSHGCFADYIEGYRDAGDVFGRMNGKGVFLYATRGAPAHLNALLSENGLTMQDVDLVIEHQANFALIPMTMERVLDRGQPDLKAEVIDFVANRMVTNIHERGNCSVVCMQRLPYDLHRGALSPDTIQGFPINRNLERLRQARIILNDSVGSGMTRSSFLQRL